MKFLAIVLFTMMQQTSVAPEITLQWNEKPNFDSEERIFLSLTVETVNEYGKVKLLPLELQGLRHISSSSKVLSSSVDRNKKQYRFDIVLEALTEGNGTVGEFQVELVKTDINENENPELITYPGFSIHIARQLSLAEQWPWVLVTFLVLGLGVFAFIKIKKGSQKIQGEFSPVLERKEKLLKELHEFRIRAEWKKCVDLAFNAILAEVTEFDSKDNNDLSTRLSQEDMNEIASQWPEFPAIYRLGEEVRYGGYIPRKKESVFISDFIGELYSQKREDKTQHIEEIE